MGQTSTARADRCTVSPRCRQPLKFMVVGGSWPSTVCENHLGLLVSRRLSGSSTEPLTVSLLSVKAGA